MPSTESRRRIAGLGFALALVLGLAVGGGRATARESPGGTGGMSVAHTQAAMADHVRALTEGEAFDAGLADNVSLTAADTGEVIRGRAAVAQTLAALHREAFAARSTVSHLLVGTGQATVEAEFVGTQVGPFVGIPATNRVVRVSYAAAYDLHDGQITAIRLYFPVAAVRHQLAGKPRLF